MYKKDRIKADGKQTFETLAAEQMFLANLCPSPQMLTFQQMTKKS